MGIPNRIPPSPYAQLEKIFNAVKVHNPSHRPVVIERIVSGYATDKLDDLYAEALLWSKTFVAQSDDTDGKALRQAIVNYVMQRGMDRRKQLNAREAQNRIDPAS